MLSGYTSRNYLFIKSNKSEDKRATELKDALVFNALTLQLTFSQKLLIV